MGRLHVHADDLYRDPAGERLWGIPFNEGRVVGLAIGDDDEAVGAIAVLGFPLFKQAIGPEHDVLAQRRATSGCNAGQLATEACQVHRAERVDPAAVLAGRAEDEQSEVGLTRELLDHFLQSRLGDGHPRRAGTRHLFSHRARCVEHHHDVVGALEE